MESIRELKEALTARSQTKSLEELTSGGARRVKVIRAEHIGAMIDEAVQRVSAESGLISREEAELLVQRSREEFATVHAERQREADELATARRELQSEGRRRHVLEQHVASLEDSLEALEREREDACAQAVDLQQALEAAESRALELEQALADARSPAPAGDPTGGPDVQHDRAPVAGAQSPAAAAAPASGQPLAPSAADPLTAALEKLTSSMTDRLEQMGRKMGISGAVEADSVSLDGLFADLDEQKFESNLDSLEVKQRQSGGIAANLARLKKLKGGGE